MDDNIVAVFQDKWDNIVNNHHIRKKSTLWIVVSAVSYIMQISFVMLYFFFQSSPDSR